jgi:hypothetical protein
MMKRMIGFFASKTVGFDPSKTPAWGVARLVLVGEEVLDRAVTVDDSMDATDVAISDFGVLLAERDSYV